MTRGRSKNNEEEEHEELFKVKFFNSAEGSLREFLAPLSRGVSCEGFPSGLEHCHGVEIEHFDGSISCTLGVLCAGAVVIHLQSETCGLVRRCDHCDGKS